MYPSFSFLVLFVNTSQSDMEAMHSKITRLRLNLESWRHGGDYDVATIIGRSRCIGIEVEGLVFKGIQIRELKLDR